MSIAGGTRVAGKVLGDFFKSITPVISSVAEQVVLNKLAAKYSPREEKFQTGVYPARPNMREVYKPNYPRYGLSDYPTTQTVIPKAASTRVGKIITKIGPENIAKVAGAAAPVAIVGGLAGAGALLSARQQSGYSLPVQTTAVPTRQPAFATQQYIPGVSPLTNEQMGEALLDQQRFQHQMELIQARQVASPGMASFGMGTGIQDILGTAQKIYG